MQIYYFNPCMPNICEFKFHKNEKKLGTGAKVVRQFFIPLISFNFLYEQNQKMILRRHII